MNCEDILVIIELLFQLTVLILNIILSIPETKLIKPWGCYTEGDLRVCE